MLLAVIAAAAATGFNTFWLFSALWGYGSSWLAEVIKQDHWPKPVNALIANAMLIVSAALATFTETTFTWSHFSTALILATVAALSNHQFILKGFGIGDWLQTKTSFTNGVATNTTTVDTARLAEVLEAILLHLKTVSGRPVTSGTITATPITPGTIGGDTPPSTLTADQPDPAPPAPTDAAAAPEPEPAATS